MKIVRLLLLVVAVLLFGMAALGVTGQQVDLVPLDLALWPWLRC
jgi:hypothetical protein